MRKGNMPVGGGMEPLAHKTLKVGDLARQSGKSVRALRLYEELDLLHPVARSHGGFRLYDESALTRIRWIELLQEAGLSLHQIQGLLKAWHGSRNAPEAMAEVRETFAAKLAETRQAIARYEMLATELEGTLEYLRTCQACRPPRTTSQDCPHCPEDHGMKSEPALVAGFHTDPGRSDRIVLPIAREIP